MFATETAEHGRDLASLLLLLLACALVVAGAATAAPPPSRYPLDLDVAIGKAYPGTLSGIRRSCTVWLNGGRDEYALAAVTLHGGAKDVAGFQFINTAGWFTMWRHHAPTAAVPAGQKAAVGRIVRLVAARCGTRWAP